MGRVRDWLGRKLLGLTPAEFLTVREVSREFAAIRLEWAETLDFIQHWANRQAKRDQRAVKTKLGEPAAEHHQEGDPPPFIPSGDRHAMKAALRQRAAALRGSNGVHLKTGSEP